MTESTRRTFRRVAIISVLAFALLLPLAVLCLVHLSDSAAGVAVDRLRPGMASDEVEEVLADVPHFKITTRSGEEVLVEGLGGYASVKVANGRVTAVERRPDRGPYWERTRRGLEQLRRAWEWRLRRQKALSR